MECIYKGTFRLSFVERFGASFYQSLYLKRFLFIFVLKGVDRRILIWDLGSASQVCELKDHTHTVYQLVFSRDGTLLASGGLDNCVKLWDVASFEENSKSMDPTKWSVYNVQRKKIFFFFQIFFLFLCCSLLGSYRTKCTSIHCLHFTRKNLLLASGPYNE